LINARIIAATLLFASAFGGCSTMFNHEYYVEQDYDAGFVETIPDSGIQEVRTYSGMRDAIETLISEYASEGTIRTKNYSGTVEDDISRAINAVGKESPLGVYAVDYIRPDTHFYLTYYEIDLKIYYTRTKGELDELLSVNSTTEFYGEIDNALDEFYSDLAFELAVLRISEESILNYIHRRIENDANMPEMPVIDITAYPDMRSLRKIVIITLTYSGSREVMLAKRMNNKLKAELAAAEISEEEPEPSEPSESAEPS
jgi:hypothetical protein